MKAGTGSGTPIGEALKASDISRAEVRADTLIAIRWIAIAGQFMTLLIVRYGLSFDFPVLAPLLTVGASAILNTILALRVTPARHLRDAEAAAMLAFDLAQLGLLLYLTGGMSNPFAFMMLVPVTISATVLSRRSTFLLLGFALLICLLISIVHRPLPWPDRHFVIPETYLIGVFVALAFSMVFLAIYAERMACDARRHVNALAAAQAALAREQKLSGLGALAAAAAHELGTPLGTISLAIRDLLKMTPESDPRHDDLALIDGQIGRCRGILAQLGDRALAESPHPFEFQPLETLIREVTQPFDNLTDVAIEIMAEPEGPGAPPLQPVIARKDEILHGLTNFVENAVGFAHSRVVVRASWSADSLSVRIEDDGPGFDPNVLKRLGEPYISLRHEQERGGLGLGVFIAKTLLERTGAQIGFFNGETGGAHVQIVWPRHAVERGWPDGTGAGEARKETRYG